MIKGKIFLGLLAGFTAGTMLGALFASSGSKDEDSEKKKKSVSSKKDKDDVTVTY
ncbi:MAG: hypothetical protein ACLFN2_07475 [Bacteroidales bacterium]